MGESFLFQAYGCFAWGPDFVPRHFFSNFSSRTFCCSFFPLSHFFLYSSISWITAGFTRQISHFLFIFTLQHSVLPILINSIIYGTWLPIYKLLRPRSSPQCPQFLEQCPQFLEQCLECTNTCALTYLIVDHRGWIVDSYRWTFNLILHTGILYSETSSTLHKVTQLVRAELKFISTSIWP